MADIDLTLSDADTLVDVGTGTESAADTTFSTSTSTPGPNATATETTLLALTTPFVQPPGCSSLFDWTVFTAGQKNETTLTIVASNAADPRFASCQPSGWAANEPARHFTYSPAVCPGGWTYYAMMEEETARPDKGSTSATFSTALCCAPGYARNMTDRLDAVPGIAETCFRTFNASDSMTVTATVTGTGTGTDSDGGAVTTTTVTDGWLMHNAWHISWESTDTATMTPSLPTLTRSKFLATWTPGQFVADGEGDRDPDLVSHDPYYGNLLRFMTIGIPIISISLFAFVIWCCCFVRPKRKKAEAAREAAWRATAAGPTSTPAGNGTPEVVK